MKARGVLDGNYSIIALCPIISTFWYKCIKERIFQRSCSPFFYVILTGTNPLKNMSANYGRIDIAAPISIKTAIYSNVADISKEILCGQDLRHVTRIILGQVLSIMLLEKRVRSSMRTPVFQISGPMGWRDKDATGSLCL